MKEKSIWIDSVEMPSFPSLKEDIDTDVLIIGGGIAGILCAYELKKRKIKAIVVEKNKIGQGITKNTTAFISAQHETLYQDIMMHQGINRAKEYLDINLKAVAMYKELGEKYDIDYEECSSSLFTYTSKELIDLEKRTLKLLNYKYEDLNELPLDISFNSGISFPNQATIHPLKLIKELAKELNIYENTEVLKLRTEKAFTKENKITFKKVIIATHFPFINRSGFYFTKMYQRRSYVVALKHPNIEGTFCSIDEKGFYFRKYKDYLIIGDNDRDTKDLPLIDFNSKMQAFFQDKEIDYVWSNQDCITLDGIPYIGRYDNIHSAWYVTTGFNLWGFTWAMASSFILADLIEGKRTYPLVDPKRHLYKKQLYKNLGNVVKNLANFKTPRCSHLGCALKWNKIDKVYECPCHGSRFDRKGNLLDGPAKKNINIE